MQRTTQYSQQVLDLYWQLFYNQTNGSCIVSRYGRVIPHSVTEQIKDPNLPDHNEFHERIYLYSGLVVAHLLSPHCEHGRSQIKLHIITHCSFIVSVKFAS